MCEYEICTIFPNGIKTGESLFSTVFISYPEQNTINNEIHLHIKTTMSSYYLGKKHCREIIFIREGPYEEFKRDSRWTVSYFGGYPIPHILAQDTKFNVTFFTENMWFKGRFLKTIYTNKSL